MFRRNKYKPLTDEEIFAILEESSDFDDLLSEDDDDVGILTTPVSVSTKFLSGSIDYY